MGDNGTFLISLSPILNFYLGKISSRIERREGSHIFIYFQSVVIYSGAMKVCDQNVVKSIYFFFQNETSSHVSFIYIFSLTGEQERLTKDFPIKLIPTVCCLCLLLAGRSGLIFLILYIYRLPAAEGCTINQKINFRNEK